MRGGSALEAHLVFAMEFRVQCLEFRKFHGFERLALSDRQIQKFLKGLDFPTPKPLGAAFQAALGAAFGATFGAAFRDQFFCD